MVLQHQQFHQLAARRRQVQQRRAGRLPLIRGSQHQQQQPALQLAPAQHHDGIRHRAQGLAVAQRRRVGQAQQIDRQRRVLLEHVLDLADVGIFLQHRHQAQYGHMRRSQTAAADHFGPREVITLEQVIAEVGTMFELRNAFHFFCEADDIERAHIP